MTPRSPLGPRYWLLLTALAWLAFAVCGVPEVHAEPVYNPVDARLAIADAAVLYGLSESRLLRVAACESSMDPYAVGDSGHSFGLAQLSDRSTGLLAHFHALGYVSAFDPYESADYLGRVFSGEFAAQGVTWRRWSCG